MARDEVGGGWTAMASSFYIGIDPVIVRVGPVVVSWYVVMIALAALVLLGWVVLQNRRRVLAVSHETLSWGRLIALVSGMLFSKLLHVIDQWSYYTPFSRPESSPRKV